MSRDDTKFERLSRYMKMGEIVPFMSINSTNHLKAKNFQKNFKRI